MAKTHHRNFLTNLVLAVASIVYSVVANAQSSGNAQMAALVQSTISTSIEVGQYKGNTYYAKVAAPGIAQIFRVPTGNPTSYAMVGTVINGKPTISPSEAEGFNSLDKNKLDAAIGSNAVLAAASQQQAPSFQQAQTETTNTALTGTVAQKDGGIFEVSVKDGPNVIVVDFEKNASHVLVRNQDGTRIGELQSVVGGGKLSTAGRVGLNTLAIGIHPHQNDAGNRQASLNPNSTTITYATVRGDVTVNSDNVGEDGKGGAVIPTTSGPVYYTIVAVDIARKNGTDIPLPNEQKLRSLAGR
jgi:hypothetical protein